MTRMAAELERRWLDRYLDRELSTDDRDWFESYLLDKPDLLLYLEADTALGEGLRALAARGELEVAVTAPARVRRWPLLAAAIGGLMVGIGGTLSLAAGNAGGPEASPPQLLYQVNRGSAPEDVDSEPGNPQALLTIVSVALPPLATLDSVQWQSRGKVNSLAGAQITRDGLLTVLLPRGLVEGSVLTVELTDHGERYQRQIKLQAPTS